MCTGRIARILLPVVRLYSASVRQTQPVSRKSFSRCSSICHAAGSRDVDAGPIMLKVLLHPPNGFFETAAQSMPRLPAEQRRRFIGRGTETSDFAGLRPHALLLGHDWDLLAEHIQHHARDIQDRGFDTRAEIDHLTDRRRTLRGADEAVDRVLHVVEIARRRQAAEAQRGLGERLGDVALDEGARGLARTERVAEPYVPTWSAV